MSTFSRAVIITFFITLQTLSCNVLSDSGRSSQSTSFISQLSQEEQKWLEQHSTIRVGVMKNWAPISFIDKHGDANGISVEYIQTINQKLGGRLKLVPGEWELLIKAVKNHQIDVLMDVTKRPSRESFLRFTDPYLNIPHIIIARKQAPTIESEKALSGKILALEKGFGNVEYFQKNYPEVLIHEYADTEKALEAVAHGKADAYAGNRAVAIYLINQNVITNLKVHSLLNKPGSVLSLGVRHDWPMLQSILQKALNSLSLQEKQNIQNQWVNLNIDDSFTLNKYRPYLILIALIILSLLLWSLYLKKKIGDFKQALYQQSNYDQLTGLVNRYLFQDRLQQALERADKENKAVLLLGCKLNDLTNIQKIQGQKAVEKLLIKTAQNLAHFKEIDTVARWSDNTFCFFVTDLEDQNEIDSLSKNLVKKLVDESRYFAKLSIPLSFGGCIYPKDGANSEELLSNMLLALGEARESGKNTFKFFNPIMNQTINRRLQLDQAMEDSFKNGEFTVFFQPKYDLKTQEIHCFEALLRWKHPEWGNIGPDEFIPIAEENGQIITIGKHVFKQAIEETAKWQKISSSPISIAINLSPVQLKDSRLVNFFETLLTDNQVSPHLLEIEVTEGVLLAETQSEIQPLLQLKDLGAKLSMDDFGKGYSSLSYLRRYPFEILKIDKEFVLNLENAPNNRKLIKSIIALCRELGLTVVAEGVETEAQLDFLKKHQCDIVQGFHFSPAVSAQEDSKMLLKQTASENTNS